MKWFLALASLLLACSKSPKGEPTLETQTVAAVYEGWYSVEGLPEIVEDHLHTDRFEVQFPVVKEFDRLCYPATTKQANGCFRWLLRKHKAQAWYSIEYPAAIVDPTIAFQYRVDALAIHELLHGMVDRLLRRPRADPYDKDHTDPRIWAGAGKEKSAEAIAQMAFQGWPALGADMVVITEDRR